MTATGERRAHVPFRRLETLWINTGTLCNIACTNCYIDSSPTNNRLAFITLAEVAPHIDAAVQAGAREIGFTGGEPFMNPDIIDMARYAVERSAKILILTNAMQPMQRPKVLSQLQGLIELAGPALNFRVSLDHFTPERHDSERGAGAFAKTMAGLDWLNKMGAHISIAGRSAFNDGDPYAGYQALFDRVGLPLTATDQADLVVFPEMSLKEDPPEISEACWDILGKDPTEMMCATSRMLVKRSGANEPALVSCTLLAYEKAFEMGGSMEEASGAVHLNHPYCAQFCVLGGASCSG